MVKLVVECDSLVLDSSSATYICAFWLRVFYLICCSDLWPGLVGWILHTTWLQVHTLVGTHSTIFLLAIIPTVDNHFLIIINSLIQACFQVHCLFAVSSFLDFLMEVNLSLTHWYSQTWATSFFTVIESMAVTFYFLF